VPAGAERGDASAAPAQAAEETAALACVVPRIGDVVEARRQEGEAGERARGADVGVLRTTGTPSFTARR